MFKLVSAAPRIDIGGSLMKIVTYPINIASLDYVPAWLFVLILAFVFGILFMSSIKVFKENLAVAIIVPLTISLIVLLTTPFASWFLWIFSWSWIAGILLIFLGLVASAIRAYAVIHGWGAEGVANIKETNDDFRQRTKYFQRKEEDATKRELKDLKDVLNQIKQAKKNEGQPDYSDQIRDVAAQLSNVGKRIVEDINLERKRFAEAHQDAVEELMDLKRKIRADLEDGVDALGNKRLGLAERFVKRAMKKLKKFKKNAKRLAKKVKSGPDTQETETQLQKNGSDVNQNDDLIKIIRDYVQAWEREVDGFLSGEGGINEGHVELRKKQLIDGLKKEFKSRNVSFDEAEAWNKYFRAKEEEYEKALANLTPEAKKMIGEGVPPEEKKLLMDGKQLEPQKGEAAKEWKEIIEDRLKKVSQAAKFKSDRRLKNVKEVKDKIWINFGDGELIQAISALGYADAMDTWKSYFNDALSYFEASPENRADEKTWAVFVDNTNKYKSFLESIRDQL